VTERLPLWRTISGLAVLGSLVAVLLALVPIYIGNFRLTQFLKSVAADSSAPEQLVRSAIVNRARQLGLPLQAGDIQISHDGGKLQLSTRYKVQKDLGPAHIDLHFHPAAR
jgi:hypothetical protein